MYDEYFIENLMIGNRVTIYNVGGSTGINNLTDGPYIFYKVPTEDGKKQKYKEIFTEDVYKLSSSIEKQKFGKTYIVKSDNIKKYINKDELTKGSVNKVRLLEIYNKVREDSYKDTLNNHKQKTLQR
ncbi:MAG: hypothetical protein J6G98_02710 [Bacilli bacterium]|nr:hypothetical protein [Bacilli bacterium]